MSDQEKRKPDEPQPPEDDELEVEYPEEPKGQAADLSEETEAEVTDLVDRAQRAADGARSEDEAARRGYVCNARNAPATSEEFPFWAPAEDAAFAIGSIVRHDGASPGGTPVRTYGIVVATQAQTLGLDDLAVHVYETDAHPPLEAIVPAPSRRRPIVLYRAKVLTSSEARPRSVQTGPVLEVPAAQLLEAHGSYLGKPKDCQWLEREGMVLGFYEDARGNFGVFAEERGRVLGPRQGHLVLSGAPGAGKTSQFQALLIGLYAQLRRLAADSGDQSPRVAAVAFNVKGADLLFLDHLDCSELTGPDREADRKMWQAIGVDTAKPPFGRVLVYIPLAEDGLNRHTLRTNPGADVTGYSETREFALGIADLWPYLGLFFDNRSTAAATLLAEVREHFQRTQAGRFTLANILEFFRTTLLLPKAQRAHEWEHHSLATISAVYSRLHALGTMLGGLIDHTGTGFGLEELTDLQPYDLVVIDLERIMADPPDPELAEVAIKIVTRYVLQRLTEAVTRRRAAVDHVIVFADELNRLAPARGDSGVGEYLAHLARTTRDRGVVLFGAGQFRSGINSDILKAAAVHYSMQTPEYELGDPIYSTLSPEFKARLTRLQPGETLLQFPSLRTPVFARFPRPFVLGGAKGPQKLPPAPPLPLGKCIAERLDRLDPGRPPHAEEVCQLVEPVLASEPEAEGAANTADRDRRADERDLLAVLRGIEMEHSAARRRNRRPTESPWEQFRRLVRARYGEAHSHDAASDYTPTPDSAYDVPWDGGDDEDE